MKFKPVLLGSVSVAALASATAVAQAQDATPKGYTLTLEGGATYAKSSAEDKIGSGSSYLDFQDDIGYRGSIGLGQKIDDSLDWKIALGFVEQMPSSTEYYSAGPFSGGSITTDFDYQMADLEIGFSPATDANLRLFGGVRGMHFKDGFDVQYDKVGSGVSFEYTNEFFGAGPRVGAEGSVPIGDTMFGISGMIAGSALYGVQRQRLDITYYSGGSSYHYPTSPEEKWGTVLDLEAALGLDVNLNDATKVTVGLRAQNISGISSISGGSGGDYNRFSYGPTIKLVSGF